MDTRRPFFFLLLDQQPGLIIEGEGKKLLWKNTTDRFAIVLPIRMLCFSYLRENV